jgi:hypothetical protein
MRFSRETIKGLDDDEFSAAEKKFLFAKFFPKEKRAALQQKLKREWTDKTRWPRLVEKDFSEPWSAPYRWSDSQLRTLAVLSPPRPRWRNMGIQRSEHIP